MVAALPADCDMPVAVAPDPRTGVDPDAVRVEQVGRVGRVVHRAAAAVLLAAVGALAGSLSGCSTPPPAEAQVVVRILASAHPEGYEVHLAQSAAGFRSAFRMRSGQTRTIAVPAGWVTVRVAGLCVVPAAASGTMTVEVRPDDCRIA